MNPPIERHCSCGLRIWEYEDAPTLFAMTPIEHSPHPSEDDADWVDWYIVTDEMLSDFWAVLPSVAVAV